MKKLSSIDFSLLAGIGLIWGSQFVFNELALKVMPPLAIAAARLGIGFITLSVVLWIFPKLAHTSEGAPPVKQPWGMYGLIAVAEGIFPCFFIPWGQQQIDSSIAAILMATIPIFTLLIAPFMVKEERWNLKSTLSVLVGFIGVVILVGPHIQDSLNSHLLGQVAILVASLSFAISLILMRRLPPVPPVLAMRNILMIAAIPIVLLSLVLDKPWGITFDVSSLAAVVLLGTFCGGLVYVLVIVLINRAGPTFTSLNNYLVTLVGVFIGILFLGDKLKPHNIVALVLILLALGISQVRGRGSAK